MHIDEPFFVDSIKKPVLDLKEFKATMANVMLKMNEEERDPFVS